MRYFVFCLIGVLILSSCSLFRLSIVTQERPLSTTQLMNRVLCRGFYGDFCHKIISCADSIISTSDDTALKINVIKWKRGATAACSVAAFNGVADVALVNTWVLVIRMHEMLKGDLGQYYFNSYASAMTNVTKGLVESIDSIAFKVLPRGDFIKTRAFVYHHATTDPMTDLLFVPDDLAVEYASIARNSDYTSVGLLSEVIADLNDRMSSYSNQFVNDVVWSKDIVLLQLGSDSLGGDFKMYADSLRQMFSSTISVFDSIPRYVDYGSEELEQRILQFESMLNSNMEELFDNVIGRQRALEQFIDAQRKTLVTDIDYLTASAIVRIEQAVPAVVQSVVWWIVVLFLVLSFVPFLAGFVIGRLQNKKK